MNELLEQAGSPSRERRGYGGRKNGGRPGKEKRGNMNVRAVGLGPDGGGGRREKRRRGACETGTEFSE